jgi:hypothetical protein
VEKPAKGFFYHPTDTRGQGNLGQPDMRDPYGFDKDRSRLETGNQGRPFQGTTEEPVVEEPIVEDLITEEPAVTEPVATDPVSPEPVVEEPTTTDPIASEPTATEPTSSEPTPTVEPVVEEPTSTTTETTDPLVEEPITTDTTVTEPAPTATEPIAEEPPATTTETIDPAVEESTPTVSEPAPEVIAEPVVEEQPPCSQTTATVDLEVPRYYAMEWMILRWYESTPPTIAFFITLPYPQDSRVVRWDVCEQPPGETTFHLNHSIDLTSKGWNDFKYAGREVIVWKDLWVSFQDRRDTQTNPWRIGTYHFYVVPVDAEGRQGPKGETRPVTVWPPMTILEPAEGQVVGTIPLFSWTGGPLALAPTDLTRIQGWWDLGVYDLDYDRNDPTLNQGLRRPCYAAFAIEQLPATGCVYNDPNYPTLIPAHHHNVQGYIVTYEQDPETHQLVAPAEQRMGPGVAVTPQLTYFTVE